MALSQQFEVSENIGGTILYLNDETGTYDAINNTGGYGAPNTERDDLALIVIAKYKATSGATEITANTYDPESVTQFVYESLEGDGWYQFLVYSIARKTGSETPTLNDFVYDFTTNQLERWNGSAWVSATNDDLETYDVAHQTVNHAHIPELFQAFNRLNELLIIGCDVAQSDLQEYKMETDTIINGGLGFFTSGNYAEFQSIIEKYQSRVDQIIAIE